MSQYANFRTAILKEDIITRVIFSACRLCPVAFCLVGMFATTGCGSGQPELVPVAGQVTMDDAPVSLGRIEFFPESGRPAGGDIDSDGRYQLTTYQLKDGAALGRYRVAITSKKVTQQGFEFSSMEEEIEYGAKVAAGELKPKAQPSRSNSSGVSWIVPKKFSSRTTSGLTAVVQGDGADINFSLRSVP